MKSTRSFKIFLLGAIVLSLPACGGGGSGLDDVDVIATSIVITDEASLRSAIDLAQNAEVISLGGASISVSDTIEITKPITLQGPGTLNVTKYSSVLKLSANGIKIKGITFANPQGLRFESERLGTCGTRAGPENPTIGVVVNASNVEISNSTFDQFLNGISTQNTDGAFSSLLISGNKFQKMFASGYDWCGGAAVSINIPRTIVINNSFSQEDNPESRMGARGIWIGGGATDTEVSLNTIDGIYFDAITVNSGAPRHLIRGNTTNGSGIGVNNSSDVTVTNNRVVVKSAISRDRGNLDPPSHRAGVRVFNSPRVEISSNQLLMAFTTNRLEGAGPQEVREGIQINGGVNSIIRGNTIGYPSASNRIPNLLRIGIAFFGSYDGFLMESNQIDPRLANQENNLP